MQLSCGLDICPVGFPSSSRYENSSMMNMPSVTKSGGIFTFSQAGVVEDHNRPCYRA